MSDLDDLNKAVRRMERRNRELLEELRANAPRSMHESRASANAKMRDGYAVGDAAVEKSGARIPREQRRIRREARDA